MNKGELINKIAEEANLSKSQATEALSACLSAISETLKDGERASLVGFGTFSVSARKARDGRNPATGETIRIPAKNVIKFKPGKELNATVN